MLQKLEKTGVTLTNLVVKGERIKNLSTVSGATEYFDIEKMAEDMNFFKGVFQKQCSDVFGDKKEKPKQKHLKEIGVLLVSFMESCFLKNIDYKSEIKNGKRGDGKDSCLLGIMKFLSVELAKNLLEKELLGEILESQKIFSIDLIKKKLLDKDSGKIEIIEKAAQIETKMFSNHLAMARSYCSFGLKKKDPVSIQWSLIKFVRANAVLEETMFKTEVKINDLKIIVPEQYVLDAFSDQKDNFLKESDLSKQEAEDKFNKKKEELKGKKNDEDFNKDVRYFSEKIHSSLKDDYLNLIRSIEVGFTELDKAINAWDLGQIKKGMGPFLKLDIENYIFGKIKNQIRIIGRSEEVRSRPEDSMAIAIMRFWLEDNYNFGEKIIKEDSVENE